jgi:hypothetical protein
MKRTLFGAATALVFAVTTVAALLNDTARAATLSYPGAAPCATTLQACIDAALPGDIVQLATNSAIVEVVTFAKSLTLEPAPGFTPQLQGAFVSATTTTVDVTIRNLTITFAISGRLGVGGGNLIFRALNNTITASQRSAIEVSDGSSVGTYGSKTLIATGNRITQTGDTFSCASAISAVGTSANFDATITENQIIATELSQCAGIEAVVGAGPTGGALIDRNRITGSNFDQGIVIRNFGANVGQPAGLMTAVVTNNLVAGQNGNVGAPGSVVVSADGNNAAVNAQIVNNTLVGGRTGILVSARTDLGATIVGGFYNNIAAFMSQDGFSIDSALASFGNANNLTFGNASNSFTAGPGTRSGDPNFVNAGAGNYALALGSNAIDGGLDSALPLTYVVDLPGGPRRVGPIDIGAFESAVVRPADPVPSLGGPALWALIMLMLVTATLGFVRKERQ